MNKYIILSSVILHIALAQFPNGRVLEPPVPALCSQRVG